jgi:hypothetical protein
MSYMSDLDIQRRNEEGRTILDHAAIKALALSTLDDDEIKALSSKAYQRADERHVSHLPILSSLLLTAMQEKGIDCSSCLVTSEEPGPDEPTQTHDKQKCLSCGAWCSHAARFCPNPTCPSNATT